MVIHNSTFLAETVPPTSVASSGLILPQILYPKFLLLQV